MEEAGIAVKKEAMKKAMEVTRPLMEKLAAARYEHLGAEVVRASKRAIIDGLGCTIAGSITKTGKTIREYAVSESANGRCILVGDGRRTGPAMAALDFDDVQWQVVGHPTVCILPAILALAEEHDKCGRDYILGYAVGIETGAKIGAGVNMNHYELGWHATGTIGTLCASGAASKILGQDALDMRNTIGIAVSRAGGVRQNFGTDRKHLPRRRGGAEDNGNYCLLASSDSQHYIRHVCRKLFRRNAIIEHYETGQQFGFARRSPRPPGEGLGVRVERCNAVT